ncbi:hypothetical protein ACFE04_031420 [Oxalis oulophora]
MDGLLFSMVMLSIQLEGLFFADVRHLEDEDSKLFCLDLDNKQCDVYDDNFSGAFIPSIAIICSKNHGFLQEWMDLIQALASRNRYAISDEIGVPFAITVDSTSSVTIRERDNKDQVRVNVDRVVQVVKALSDGLITWEDVWANYSHHI